MPNSGGTAPARAGVVRDGRPARLAAFGVNSVYAGKPRSVDQPPSPTQNHPRVRGEDVLNGFGGTSWMRPSSYVRRGHSSEDLAALGLHANTILSWCRHYDLPMRAVGPKATAAPSTR